MKSGKKPEVSVIIPAYNEEEGIGETLDGLKEVLEELDVEIVVVDDGSKDNTKKEAQKRGVDVLEHPINLGYGASLKTGIRNASGEKILIIDADGTYPPKAAPKLLETSKRYDLVVGVRTEDNKEVSVIRKPLRKMAAYFASYLTGREIPDVNSGMRVFPKSFAMKHLSEFPDKFSFSTTSTLLAVKDGLSISHIPIPYEQRHGRSKLNLISDGLGFPVKMARLAMHFNPFKVFAPFGGFLFLLGALLSLARMDVTDSTVILMSVGVQIVFFGLLGEVVAKK